jgi:hypothetical protein
MNRTIAIKLNVSANEQAPALQAGVVDYKYPQN